MGPQQLFGGNSQGFVLVAAPFLLPLFHPKDTEPQRVQHRTGRPIGIGSNDLLLAAPRPINIEPQTVQRRTGRPIDSGPSSVLLAELHPN